MPMLIALVGLLSAAAFWWYRAKYLREAAGEALDAAGHMRGFVRRKVMQHKAELSVLTALNDPVVAAAVLMVSIVYENRPVTPRDEMLIRASLSDIATPEKVQEAVVYGKWASGQVNDASITIDQLAPMLKERLNSVERAQLVNMIRDLHSKSAMRTPSYDHRIIRLRKRLELLDL